MAPCGRWSFASRPIRVSRAGAKRRTAWRAGELSVRRSGLLAALAGREVFAIESILALDVCDDAALACGIEMALWDLVARSARQPLCHLLGGQFRPIVPLSVRLPMGAAEPVAHWARSFSAQGVQSLVVSATGTLEADYRLATLVAESCGPRVQIRFDARQLYDLATATQLCAALEHEGLQFVVDPLAGARPEGLAALGSRTLVPLAASLAIRRPADVMQLARHEAVDFIVVDPVHVGGIQRARQCAAVAEAAGLTASLRIEGTSGLALAATLQLAAATPAFTSGHESSYPKLHDDILTEPLRVVEGMLSVPSGIGLGVEVDRDKLDWYQVGG